MSGGGGQVTDTAVVMDNEANLSRGFGFVTFAERSAAEDAVKACNNKEISKLCTLHGRSCLLPPSPSRSLLCVGVSFCAAVGCRLFRRRAASSWMRERRCEYSRASVAQRRSLRRCHVAEGRS